MGTGLRTCGTNLRVRIPVWLALAAAAFVVFFGVYRIKLGLTMSADGFGATHRATPVHR